MPTTQEKWQEIANRGLQDNFEPDKRAKFDEAVKRGLITLGEPLQRGSETLAGGPGGGLETPALDEPIPAFRRNITPDPEAPKIETTPFADLGIGERIMFNLRSKLSGEKFAQEARGREGKLPVDTSGDKTFKNLSKDQKLSILEVEARNQKPEFFTQEEIDSFNADERIPELRPNEAGGLGLTAKLTAALATTSDNTEQAAIAQNLIPNSEIRQRFDDAWVIQFPDPETGELIERVVNKPGPSPIDAANISADIGKGLLASRASGAVAGAGLGRGIARALTVGGTGAGIQTGVEAIQSQIGGEFDFSDIVLEGALNFAGEAIPTAAKAVFNRLTKDGKAKVSAAKTLDDLLDSGLKREDAALIVKEWDTLTQEAKKQGIDAPTVEQVSASFAEKGFQLPAQKALGAARQSELAGRVIEKQGAEAVESVTQAAKGVTDKLSSATPTEALQGVQETASEIIGDAKLYRSKTAQAEYDKVRELAPEEGIDVSSIINDVEKILEVTPNIASIKNHLGATKKALETLKTPTRTVVSPATGVKTTTGGETKLPFDMLQQVNFLMRDLAKVQNDKSITSAVKQNAKSIEKQITTALNNATGGAYSKADAIYKRMSDSLDILKKGRIGKAADLPEDSIGNVMDVVFNPKPTHVAVARKFMDDLTKADPQAAKDLYATYINEQIDFLPVNAKPSEILTSVFGRDRKGKNLILELAPDEASREAFGTMEKVLNALKATEGATAEQGAKAQVDRMLEQGGLFTMFSHLMRITKTTERVAESKSAARNSKAWIEAWTNQDLARDLKRIADLKLSPKETASQADNLLKRALENTSRRSIPEAAARATGVEAARLTEQSLSE